MSLYSKSHKYEHYNITKVKKNIKWQNMENFIEQLEYIQTYFNKRKLYSASEEKINCVLCKKKNIKTKIYKINKVIWDDGLLHYIKKHYIKPSEYFIEKIFKYQPGKKIISIKKHKKLKGVKIVKKNKVFLKLDKNQILIMDALYEHGSKRIYYSKKDNNTKYSEHSGLLDFNDFGLEKLIVSGKTTRIDKNDDEIYLPKNMTDAYDYEYIFHTHPITPGIGSRAKYGILYEFPSASDIFHFIDHYNNGDTQGSIVMTPEGMYVIRKYISDNNKIKIDEDALNDKLINTFNKIQKNAINIYGSEFSKNKFYSKIAQDTNHINKLNEVLHRFELHIDYFPRIKNSTGHWIIDTVYLPVYVVEPK
jgi:hypothetical protein